MQNVLFFPNRKSVLIDPERKNATKQFNAAYFQSFFFDRYDKFYEKKLRLQAVFRDYRNNLL